MAQAASHDQLREAFSHHFKETRGHLTRVEEADQTLDEESAADKTLAKIATGGMFKAGVNQQATA